MNYLDLKNILLTDKPSILIKEKENEIFSLIPEFKISKGFNQNNPWHIYDVYEHILHVIDGVRDDLILRFTALFHDIGKPYVYTEDENGIGHFYNHWNKSNEIFLNFAKKYSLDEDIIDTISKLIIYHDFNFNVEDTKMIEIAKKLGKDNIKLLFEIKRSDLKAQNEKYNYLLDSYDNQEKRINLLLTQKD